MYVASSVYYAFHILLRLLQFFLFPLLCVHIHEWQSHIRLGHYQRVGSLEVDSSFAQILFQYLHRPANTVASGAQSGNARSADGQFADKLPYYLRRSPSVHGKHYPCILVLRLKSAVAIDHVWYEYQLVVGRLGKSFGSPSCIACA